MRARQGFTLLELMTSIVITIIILLAVAASFTAIQTIYQREAQLKGAVESGRVATGYIERVTRMIGYGIDPRFAIDIGTNNLTPASKTNIATAAVVAGGVLVAPSFITDDFAFRYRDPSYLRRGRFDQTNVIIDNSASASGGPANFNIALPTGRLLQIVCAGGQFWAVVKTNGPIAPADTQIGAGSANVAGNLTSFPPHPTAAEAPCLNFTGDRAPYIMLVREVRLRVKAEGSGPNIRPFLVAYNTLETGTTVDDYDPIAADVESFHVSYVMNKNPGAPALDVAGGDWVLGNDPGDTTLVPTAVGGFTRPPLYDAPYADPARFTDDAANVRAVVFEISTRSLRQEKRSAFPQPRLADDPAAAATVSDGYFRNVVSTTVRTPNLTSRSGFTPPLRVVGNPFPLNEWGG